MSDHKLTPAEIEQLLQEMEPEGLVRVIGRDPEGRAIWEITQAGKQYIDELDAEEVRRRADEGREAQEFDAWPLEGDDDVA
jgi:DNA-binding PadR family transcriptional regulator